MIPIQLLFFYNRSQNKIFAIFDPSIGATTTWVIEANLAKAITYTSNFSDGTNCLEILDFFLIISLANSFENLFLN